MPIEIREIRITAEVSDNPAPAPSGAGPAAAPAAATDKAALVAECVEQVLTILRERQER